MLAPARPPRIIHATDFSTEANAAEAVRLARALGGELLLLHVAVEAPLYGETPFGMRELKKLYEGQARWAEDKLADRVIRSAACPVVVVRPRDARRSCRRSPHER